MAEAVAGYRNASGLAAAVAFQEEPLIPVMLLARVISALRSETLAGNMAEISGVLTDRIYPVQADARKLAALPDTEREAKLARLPWRDQNKLRRLIERSAATTVQGDQKPTAPCRHAR